MKKILVTLIVLTMGLTVMLTGCGSKGETPDQAVTNALKAVKTLDKENIEKYLSYDQLTNYTEDEENALESEELLKQFFAKLDYKIVSSNVEENIATVKTEITNIDLKNVIGEYVKRAMAIVFENAFKPEGEQLTEEAIQEQGIQILNDILKESQDKTVTNTVDIKLTKNEDGWKITMDETLQSALTGGLTDAIKDMGNIGE